MQNNGVKKIEEHEVGTFFNISQDLMCIVSADGLFEKANQAFSSLLGHSIKNLLKKPFLDLVHPDDKKATRKEMEKLAKDGSTITFMNRYQTKDGSHIWLQWSATRRNTKLFATGRDISDAKRTETQAHIQQKKLGEITNRFSFATKSAGIGIWEWDIIEDQLTWDDQMYKLYNIQKKDFSGAYDAWQAGLHPTDKKTGDDAIQAALAGSKKFDLSFRVIWPDKSIHYIKAFGVVERDADGTPLRMVGVNWDITKDKAVETSLKQFEAIIRDTDDAIISKTLDATVTGWNEGAKKLYGYKPSEMIGKSIKIIVPPKHDDLDTLLAKIAKGERIPNYATIRRRKDGSLVDVSLTISPINNDAGEVTGASVVARDISKEKEIDKAKTEFVSLASHQLNTPVGHLKWNLEMFLNNDYGSITKLQKDVLAEMYEMSKRMSELVSGLLNVSRIEMGTFMINPSPTQFDKVSDEVLSQMMPLSTKKKHVITKKYDEKLPPVAADPNLLRIIFQNLISNAIKYTQDEGRVQVSLSVASKDIVFSVANNGEPIPKSDQPRIFQKLFRAGNAQAQDTNGNGLGLYMVKQIVERAGGRIWFTSQKGQDTVFSVSFPLSGMAYRKGTKKLGQTLV